MFSLLWFYLQEDMEMAKYIARLFTARHKFYKQNKICVEWVSAPLEYWNIPNYVFWNRGDDFFF